MSQGIFISYRRSDSSGYAHALATRLVQQFGAASVFMDVDSLEPGVDFVETIGNSLSSCKILLALIGNNWTGPQKGGKQRILDYSDYVRIEVADALGRGIRVIPVLIDNASMPQTDDLPDDLESLTRRQAIEWSNTRFNSDLERIVDATKKAIGWEETGKRKPSTHARNATEPPTKTPDDHSDVPVVKSGQDEENKDDGPNQATPNLRAPIQNRVPPPVTTPPPSYARTILRLGFSILLGLGVFYVAAIQMTNKEIPVAAGIVGFVFALTITARRRTLKRVFAKLFFAGLVVVAGNITLNEDWDSVLHNAGGLVKKLSGVYITPQSQPAPTSAGRVVASEEQGSLWNFQVTQQGGDFIWFTVEFKYVGPASKICVGGVQASNGTDSKYSAYRSHCEPVVSGQASGTAKVYVSTSMPWHVFNFTSNQINVTLFRYNKDVYNQYFPFNKDWKK